MKGWHLPPFILLKGVHQLQNWYLYTNLPRDWMIKPAPNGWTDNDTALEWLEHLERHTIPRTKGLYRLLVVDGHDSHINIKFDEYCRDHHIVPLCLPAHSSHLLQPLDVGCFRPLKRDSSDSCSLCSLAKRYHVTLDSQNLNSENRPYPVSPANQEVLLLLVITTHPHPHQPLTLL